MDKFVFQSIILFLFFLTNKKDKGVWLCPSNFIYFLYALCGFLGIFTISIEGYTEPYSERYWMPMLCFLAITLVSISPFKSFNEEKTNELLLPSLHVLNVFSTFIIILSFYSLIYCSKGVLDVFAYGNLGDARFQMTVGNVSFQSTSIWNTIASVGASLNIIAFLLFFIYTSLGGHKGRRLLLLISTMSEPVQVLTFVGRDGVVFWIFALIFCFLLFKSYIVKEERKRIVKYVTILLLILILPFILITISRFGQMSSGGGDSFISYLGQGFINGPLLFGIENLQTSGGSCFPLFFEITGIKSPESLGRVQIGDWKSWGFSTSIGSLYYNLGKTGLVIMVLSFVILFRATMGRFAYRLRFHLLFIYLLYFRLIAEGVFYFREYTRGGNLFIILLILFSLIFKQIGYRNGIILEKQPS